MIFLLDSYSRRSLKLFSWFGLSDTFTRTWSAGLSCVFVVSSLPAMAVVAPNHFDFRVVLWFGLFLHQPLCLTRNKSVPYLVSTPQSRSQQQTEILIHLLKKLTPVNDISGVLYLVDPMWLFSSRIWRQLNLWTWCQSVVPNDAPRDFGPEVAFGVKFQIPVARQGGREMSAPRPYVTEPFRPLSSINNW